MKTRTLNANGQEWTDLDLTGSNLGRAILDEYTFGGLLLEISCNVREITPASIRLQFHRELQAKTRSAIEVFEANAESIFLHAVSQRQQDEEARDDMGEPYAEGWLRRLPYGAPDQRGATLVGPAGYLKAKRLNTERDEATPAWSDLEEQG